MESLRASPCFGYVTSEWRNKGVLSWDATPIVLHEVRLWISLSLKNFLLWARDLEVLSGSIISCFLPSSLPSSFSSPLPLSLSSSLPLLSFPSYLPLFLFCFLFYFYKVCGLTFSDKAVLWGSQRYLLLTAFQGHCTLLLSDYSILLLAWWLCSDSVKSYVSLSSKCSVWSYWVPCPLGWITLGISLRLCHA